MLTLKVDRQVISSSPPAQSIFPSQVFSSGMNFTDFLQKKYLLSINILTEKKKRMMGITKMGGGRFVLQRACVSFCGRNYFQEL